MKRLFPKSVDLKRYNFQRIVRYHIHQTEKRSIRCMLGVIMEFLRSNVEVIHIFKILNDI